MLSFEVTKKIDTKKLERLIEMSSESIRPTGDFLREKIKQDAPHSKIKTTIKSQFIKAKTFVAYTITTAAWWWHFFEYGTKAHKVEIKDKQVLSDGSIIYGTSVSIPAMSPKSFVRKNRIRYGKKLIDNFKETVRRIWGN